MIDDDRKLLTEFLGEEDVTGWWCPTCSKHLCWNEVTYQERHDPRSGGCGDTVVNSRFHQRRTFLTPDDQQALKDKLVGKGMWVKFYQWAMGKYAIRQARGVTQQEFAAWLFRPLNGKGESHFCQLVADFLREVKS